MASEIRSLLAAAQRAEVSGEVEVAVRHLQQAVAFYRARQLDRRADQLERYIERLEGRAPAVTVDEAWPRSDDDAGAARPSVAGASARSASGPLDAGGAAAQARRDGAAPGPRGEWGDAALRDAEARLRRFVEDAEAAAGLRARRPERLPGAPDVAAPAPLVEGPGAGALDGVSERAHLPSSGRGTEPGDPERQARLRPQGDDAVRLMDPRSGPGGEAVDFAFDERLASLLRDDEPFGVEGRVQPPDDDGLGFGDELIERHERARRSPSGLSPFDRGPQLADPALAAWCSFCCRPGDEAGQLVAGPAGAFICGACLVTSTGLLQLRVEAPAGRSPAPPAAPALSSEPTPTPTPTKAPARAELPAQAAARAEWLRRKPRVALVVGPEGTGKTAFLESLGRPAARPFTSADDDAVLVDLSTPLSADEERALLAWLDAHPTRRAVLASRGDAPAPVLVLQGAQGAEPVYDTDSLHRAVEERLSPSLLSRVDAVLPLSRPDREALRHLAMSLLAVRGAEVPTGVVETLISLAEKSGRGARELAALIARIPPGKYAGG
ncbi:MAG: ClpX C4-type zinc finger protein [Myxococcaceae bacterium]|jgi:hypothetical protein|nr:ClpX C4-type zinc finger protein [Myxococcaceae bacterium]MCA3014263.1 ClpX C4-type zinc finger protein [Myxococcaceae bacterium]